MKTWYLWGYMGSGKSTVGRAAAKSLGLEFRDLDHLIAGESGMNISDFMATRGELAFRKLERQLLLEQHNFEGILSCGGGTPCYYDNAQWMREHGETVYLSASVSWLHQRLVASRARGTKRPLLANVADENLAEFIAKHLFERRDFYATARYQIAVDKLSNEHAVSQLTAYIQTK
ncbi:MAG: shikimate kinase [Bacteroidetes bacterium]|nr:shikimate kinase [Bacteroidota bacterium]